MKLVKEVEEYKRNHPSDYLERIQKQEKIDRYKQIKLSGKKSKRISKWMNRKDRFDV